MADRDFTLTLRMDREHNLRIKEIARRTRHVPAEIYRILIEAGINEWNATGTLPELPMHEDPPRVEARSRRDRR